MVKFHACRYNSTAMRFSYGFIKSLRLGLQKPFSVGAADRASAVM